MPPPFAPDIELPLVLPTVLNDFENAKAKDHSPLVDIPSIDVKVEDAPPLVVPPNVSPLVVSIDQQEQVTTKRKFATPNNLLEWVLEESRKLRFSIFIGKSNKWDERYVGRMVAYNKLCRAAGYEIIRVDDLYLVEHLDPKDKVVAHKKVEEGIKIQKDEIIRLDDCSIDLSAD